MEEPGHFPERGVSAYAPNLTSWHRTAALQGCSAQRPEKLYLFIGPFKVCVATSESQRQGGRKKTATPGCAGLALGAGAHCAFLSPRESGTSQWCCRLWGVGPGWPRGLGVALVPLTLLSQDAQLSFPQALGPRWAGRAMLGFTPPVPLPFIFHFKRTNMKLLL